MSDPNAKAHFDLFVRQGREMLDKDPAAFVAALANALRDQKVLQSKLLETEKRLQEAEGWRQLEEKLSKEVWDDRDGIISRAAQLQSERDAANVRARIAESQLHSVNEAINSVLSGTYRDEFPGVSLVLALLKAKITELPPAALPEKEIGRAHHPKLTRKG